MSPVDLEPLARGDADPLERKVLRAARRDGPGADAKEQMLTALDQALSQRPGPSLVQKLVGPYQAGIGIVLVVGAAATMVMSASSTTASSPGPQPATSSEPAIALSAAQGPSAAGTLERAPAHARAPSEPHASEDTREQVAAPRPAPSTSAHALRGAAPKVAGAHQGAKANDASAESTLAREIARMTAARSTLAAGEAARALELLDAYDADFPAGAFALDVSVLRVEALARSGKKAEARRLGQRFLGDHPHGAFAERVTQILESAAPASADPSFASPKD